jgi:hypothetical protein
MTSCFFAAAVLAASVGPPVPPLARSSDGGLELVVREVSRAGGKARVSCSLHYDKQSRLYVASRATGHMHSFWYCFLDRRGERPYLVVRYRLLSALFEGDSLTAVEELEVPEGAASLSVWFLDLKTPPAKLPGPR